MPRVDSQPVALVGITPLLETDIFRAADAAGRGPTGAQNALSLVVILSVIGSFCFALRASLTFFHLLGLLLFAFAAIGRVIAVGVARQPRPVVKLDDVDLPPYTIIVPLHDEAAMAPNLAATLNALDYPNGKLQILVVLEPGDTQTLAALQRTKAAQSFHVLFSPEGAPQTKPRACNVALAHATGRHVVIYDAEDRPHPLQLKEAASRFAASDARVACLQAPLRIAQAKTMLQRQFSLEYAAQFEVILPALSRMGAPFPLGGTSNHFRTDALKAVGGWDAWNVTEDADLGFRLAATGLRMGLLRTPTWESAPASLCDWLPQRTRWIKGYMQTWGVHMRSPGRGGIGAFIGLQATLGLTILSVLAHGPVLLAIAAGGLIAICQMRWPSVSPADFALLVGGWGGAILAMSSGAKRAGLRMRIRDGFAAPAYWALQSLAMAFAVVQLCTRPYHWDKTTHDPPQTTRLGAGSITAGLDEKGEASVRRAA